MTEILIPVIIVAAIGLIAGLGLAIASAVFAVPVDEKRLLSENVSPVPTAALVDIPVAMVMPALSLKAKPKSAISALPAVTTRRRQLQKF